jgi:hypothetical protein
MSLRGRNNLLAGSSISSSAEAAVIRGDAAKKIFQSFDDIVDHCCYVCTLIDLSRGKSCPSRAAMANRETVAPRTLQ